MKYQYFYYFCNVAVKRKQTNFWMNWFFQICSMWGKICKVSQILNLNVTDSLRCPEVPFLWSIKLYNFNKSMIFDFIQKFWVERIGIKVVFGRECPQKNVAECLFRHVLQDTFIL